MPGRTEAALADARARLAGAASVVALTGPGLCGAVGALDPSARIDPVEFYDDPAAVWGRYDDFRARLAAAGPGPGHRALAELGRRRRLTLATEACDGLHALAGGGEVIELLGSVWHVRCTRCGLRAPNRAVPLAAPPACATCSGLLRPDVVWPGERAQEHGLVRCFAALSRCDLLLLAGCDTAGPFASAFLRAAGRSGAFRILVGAAAPPPAAEPDLLLPGEPGEVLALLAAGQGAAAGAGVIR